MQKIVVAAALLGSALLVTTGQAEARGCIRGAIVGGIAGHFAGHHGMMGAAAGCAVGHHYANKRGPDQQPGQADPNQPPPAQQ